MDLGKVHLLTSTRLLEIWNGSAINNRGYSGMFAN